MPVYSMLMVAGAVLAAFSPAAGVAHAHSRGVTPDEIWLAWRWEPLPLLLAAAGLYVRGLRMMRRRARSGAVYRWRARAFAAGALALGIAFVSPLDAMGGTLLFAHMAQHLVLILMTAPALALSAPTAPLLWALSPPHRRGLVRWWQRTAMARYSACVLRSPILAGALHGAMLWAWHLPRLYDGALHSDLLHLIEHISLLATALIFWRAVVASGVGRGVRAGAGILACFILSLTGGLLGALMTLARRPWYPVYSHHTTAWSLSALDDQQLAGLLMWGVGGMVYAAAALTLLGRWLTLADVADSTAMRTGAPAPPRPGIGIEG
ncbi:MAG: cytochrome c oxidase assembly protein [Chloroflexi bacterium]|nr:cytochrome c oxidase assembly protein [Chloroflexota bacterium]